VPVSFTTVASPSPPVRPTARRRTRFAIWGVVVLAALMVGKTLIHSATPELNPAAVAVLPWAVSGADSSLGYLRVGLMDMLDATLTGPRGLHSTDPREVLSLTSATAPTLSGAAGLARQLGAGRFLKGSVLGTAEHLTLTATLGYSDQTGP